MILFAWVAVGILFWSAPAYAIPSAVLVVGSLSSLSQIVTVVLVALGGLAVAGPRLPGVRKARAVAGPAARRVAITVAVLLLAALALNVYQFLAAGDARLARLQATLSRPSFEPGVPALDPRFKTLSYAQQRARPDGITTEKLQALLKRADHGGARNVNFIDVREPPEVRTSILPHFKEVRWPDLLAAANRSGQRPDLGVQLKGKRNVLICATGNRSSEASALLNKLGIRANFVIGGLEKWIAEGRPVEHPDKSRADQLRSVPSYPHQKVLLDTPEVRKLVGARKAVFVDTRSPAEFAAFHLPAAISIPIRTLPTPTLRRRIEALPRRPVVLACYTRRSCFYADVLGYELSRLGFDVRGRYTVPWEHYVPAKDPPYVAKWRERVSATPWRRAARQLGGLILWSSDLGFGLVGTILLLALLSRAIIFPFSLKQERDEIKLRALKDEISRLKERAGSDRRIYTRGLTALHRRHGITPVRNLIALLFVPVFVISVAAVADAARRQHVSFLWIPNLAGRDPLFVLPFLFAVIVALYLMLSVAQTGRQRLVASAVGIPVFAAVCAYLDGAADLYLFASACLMLVQRGVAALDCQALRRAVVMRRAARRGIIPLGQAHLLRGCGNKAARLGTLLWAGFDVPRGVVLTPIFLSRFGEAGHRGRERQLGRIWRTLGGDRIAVRSAAAAEDGRAHSFAGVFDTVLNVERARLGGAIAEVLASFNSVRTASYGVEAGDAYILLQPMVAAQYAGVLFTEAPGSAGAAMVEMVEGTAEAFVSGAATPASFLFGRFSGRLQGTRTPPIDLSPLLELGRRAERMFGAPQDIEWAFCKARFHLLQSRDITRDMREAKQQSDDSRLGRERCRVLALIAGSSNDTPVLAQNELSELLPRPTRISTDLMEMLWQEGGSVDLACRALGLSYRLDPEAPPYLLTAFGRLYVNKSEEQLRAPSIGPVVAFRLERAARTLERDFRERFIPEFERGVLLFEAADFTRFSTDQLHGLLENVRSDFVANTYAQVEVINIAASFFVQKARAMLAERGLNPATLLSGIPETPLTRALVAASRHRRERDRIETFVRLFGHRAALDYELSEPRYTEDRDSVRNLIAGADKQFAPVAADQVAAWSDRTLAEVVRRARLFQGLKEEAKHQALRQIAVLRRVLLALDHRYDLAEGIFDLSFDEIRALGSGMGPEAARSLVAERQLDHRVFASVPALPAELRLWEVEELQLQQRRQDEIGSDGLAGTVVSGGLPVEGRVCLVPALIAERGGPPPGFEDGDIIVSQMIHPAWLPYFRRAGGLVSGLGGWLSHVAILAREHNVPMVVGVREWSAIEAGERLRIESDGRLRCRASDKSGASSSVPTAARAWLTAVGH
jgi:rifampicin phosphotransferase